MENGLTLDQVKKLASEFVKEAQEELGVKLIWWFIGSVARGEYLPGRSDVDVIILPDESCDYGKVAMHLLKKRDDEKYPKVFKANRYTSIIDPVIFFDVDVIHKLRAEYHKVRSKKAMEAKDNGYAYEAHHVEGLDHSEGNGKRLLA